jgi:succinoglycan biosynthesis transport protein ExoP
MSDATLGQQIERIVAVLTRHSWAILLCTVVASTLSYLGLSSSGPVYTSTATVRIAQAQTGAPDYAAILYAERVVNTYVQLLASRPFLEAARERLMLEIPIEQMKDMVRVEAMPDSELMIIVVEARDPVWAADIANTLTDLLLEEGERIYAGAGKSAQQVLAERLATLEQPLGADRARLQSLLAAEGDDSVSDQAQSLRAKIQIQERTYALLLEQYGEAATREALVANSISIVERAAIADSPSSPAAVPYAAMAGLAGWLGGAGIALFLEILKPVIYAPRDLESVAHLPVVAIVPRIWGTPWRRRMPIVFGPDCRAAAAESFRYLQALLHVGDARERSLALTLMVVSAERRVGCSTVAVNLAKQIADSGCSVCLIDANLRSPVLHEVLGASRNPGLTDAVIAPHSQPHLQATNLRGVRVLGSGKNSSYPIETLGSANMAAVLAALARESDVIILDTSPILVAADTLALVPRVQGILLVVESGRSRVSRVSAAVRLIEDMGGLNIGFVLNMAQQSA